MTDQPIKLCKDCRHYRAGRPMRWFEGLGIHNPGPRPWNDTCALGPIDLVTGERYPRYPHGARSAAGGCGPRGMDFEAAA